LSATPPLRGCKPNAMLSRGGRAVSVNLRKARIAAADCCSRLFAYSFPKIV